MSHSSSSTGLRRLRAIVAAAGTAALLTAALVATPTFAKDKDERGRERRNEVAAVLKERKDDRADALKPIKGRQVHGTVKDGSVDVAAKTFVLTTKKHGEVTISFAGATPRAQDEDDDRDERKHDDDKQWISSVAELAAGDRVVAHGRVARPASTGTATPTSTSTPTAAPTGTPTPAASPVFQASRVFVIPADKDDDRDDRVKTSFRGTLAEAAAATTLKVTLKDGTTKAFTLDADTTLRPEGTTLDTLTAGARVKVKTTADGATAKTVTLGR